MNRSVMLDYVKGIYGKEDYDPEGVYEQDQEIQDEWEKPISREYDGKARCVNLGPERVKRLLTEETDPEELVALRFASDFWKRNGGYASNPEDLGWVHRGEDREAVRVGSIRQLTNGEKTSHVFVMGALASGGIPRNGGDSEFLGIIDFELLMRESPDGPMDEIGLLLQEQEIEYG